MRGGRGEEDGSRQSSVLPGRLSIPRWRCRPRSILGFQEKTWTKCICMEADCVLKVSNWCLCLSQSGFGSEPPWSCFYRLLPCSSVYSAGACRISPWDGRLLESHWASNPKSPHRKHMMWGAVFTPPHNINIVNVTTHWVLFLCVYEGQNQIHGPRLGMSANGVQGIWVLHFVLILDFQALEIPLTFACLLTFKCF